MSAAVVWSASTMTAIVSRRGSPIGSEAALQPIIGAGGTYSSVRPTSIQRRGRHTFLT
jgi:hypothetical protein